MKTLVVERSTETQSVALVADGATIGKVFPALGVRNAGWCVKVRDFLAERGLAFKDLDRFVVGTGPGSFAGVRAAIAFAQGCALGAGKQYAFGIPSAYAFARTGKRIAVVGDARRGQHWRIAFDGHAVARDFALFGKEELYAAVPEDCAVATPDGARIGDLLASIFGDRFLGPGVPLAERLAEAAEANPAALKPEPLPVYLSPAVRS